MKRYLNQQSGFTLVELVITATFVAAAVTAIVGLFIAVNSLSRQSRNLSTVTALVEQRIETYRNKPFAAIATGSPAETFTNALPAEIKGPRTAVVNVTQPQTDLMRIDVVVTYYEGKKQKRVEMTTLIARSGINR